MAALVVPGALALFTGLYAIPSILRHAVRAAVMPAGYTLPPVRHDKPWPFKVLADVALQRPVFEQWIVDVDLLKTSSQQNTSSSERRSAGGLGRVAHIAVWVFYPWRSTSPWDTLSAPLIVYSMGNGSTLDIHAWDMSRLVHKENPDAVFVCWDYCGVGRSAYSLDKTRLYAEPWDIEICAQSVLEKVRGAFQAQLKMKHMHLVCWGHSLGSWAASCMARDAQEHCARLVLSSPFSSLKDLTALAPLVGLGMFNPAANVASLSSATDLKIVCSYDDTLFPPRVHGYKLFEAFLKSRKSASLSQRNKREHVMACTSGAHSDNAVYVESSKAATASVGQAL